MDQVLAIMRESGVPMTSREIGRSVGAVFATQCPGEHCRACGRGRVPDMQIDGYQLHVEGRANCGGASAGVASDGLRPALSRGYVTREKVDRVWVWSLAAQYVKVQRETATLAAAILARAGLPAAADVLSDGADQ